MKKRPSKKDKLWLDDYLRLLHSRQTLHLTINQLNQVIRIHGFKKIHHAPKVLFSLKLYLKFLLKVLVEAVESLDLVDVPRSTLRDSVSAFAAVALEDVLADLAQLKWQECCETFVERISFSEGKSVLLASSDESFRVTSQSKSMDKIRDLIP
ncbi:hypothetical protein LR48_Vigan08g095200 [Vigna angularis]|uniref:DUF7787 domain-containing protein n=1 Tax=Phaseolus angularis TaxID=3914 RepID=A0A0L9V4W5_PHAAN|nr:uncharacterized protein HKW66_Vig0146620 [Vigna angularis]KOM50125.1 hypothetical protein LR48_Vigan08g095200 [Vigna angularis]